MQLRDYPHVREAFKYIFDDEPYGTFDDTAIVPDKETERFKRAEEILKVIASKPVEHWLSPASLAQIKETYGHDLDMLHSSLMVVAAGIDDYPRLILLSASEIMTTEFVLEFLDDFFEGELHSVFVKE